VVCLRLEGNVAMVCIAKERCYFRLLFNDYDADDDDDDDDDDDR